MNVDWLIIGGGIHGVHIAACLIGAAGLAPGQLRIVDPAERLLDRWRVCTATTGMTYLRSPTVHHLDLNPFSLRRFAGDALEQLAPPYDRPSLALFNAHCARVIEMYGLDALHIRDRIVACEVNEGGVVARGATGDELHARHAVLAIGASEQPNWPQWAPRNHTCVRHVFEPGFDGWPSAQPERVAVIGGGITAGQVALRLAREGHRVHLISRHSLREHQFDSHPGWLGPRYMSGFSREQDHARRRAVIGQARHRGSVPPDVCRSLRQAFRDGLVAWRKAEVQEVIAERDKLCLHMQGMEPLEIDRVLLATGFAPARPGGAMIDNLIESASLPCAQCGYPIVDEALRWHPRIHVTGPLAELELGPASRTIAGARRAAERLVDALRQ